MYYIILLANILLRLFLTIAIHEFIKPSKRLFILKFQKISLKANPTWTLNKIKLELGHENIAVFTLPNID